MLIAISGSQGSGKGTCINELVARHGYHTIARKTSRSILEEMNVTLDDVNSNVELLKRFQEAIITRKLADDEAARELSLKTGIPAITERCFSDLAAYLVKALAGSNEHSDYVDDYVERCTALDRIYDHVFYVKAGHFPPVSDGVRGANKHYSRMMDLLMEDMVARSLPGSHTIVYCSSVGDRVAQMEDGIRKLDTVD